MNLAKQPAKHLINRWSTLFVAVLIAATAVPQILSISPVHADDGGYPWSGALCAWTGLATGSCTNYDWGYTTCPSGDSYCTSTNQINGYYQLDDWGYGFRNCTSYAAWRINQTFNVSNITGWGNAATWNTGYTSPQPYAVYSPSTYTPQVGDIAQWGSEVAGGFGHVAYVWNVSTVNGVTIADLWDYNQAGTGLFSASNTTASNSENTPDHYIHIGTVSTNPGLGGGAASTRGNTKFDVFVEQASPSGSSNLGHIWYDGTAGGWYNWENIPNDQLMTSQPAAVSWSGSRIDVFARGQNGDLIHDWYDGSQWYNWESLGGCIIGQPSVTSWGPGRLDVFAEGCNTTGANLYHIFYANNAWAPWESIGAGQVINSAPAAVAWSSGRLDIFSQDSNNDLIHTFYTNNAWNSSWDNLGGCVVGAPAASSRGVGMLDAWLQGCNTTGANFYHIAYDGSGWHSFELVSSSTQRIAGLFGATSWANNRIDMFTRRSDNTLDHWWYDGASFNGPENKGGSIAP